MMGYYRLVECRVLMPYTVAGGKRIMMVAV